MIDMLDIIGRRKIFYGISLFFVMVSVILIGVKGMRFGIDFTGGSLLEIEYTQERVAPEIINAAVNEAGISSLLVQPIGELGYVLRMPEITDEQRRSILSNLESQLDGDGGIEEETRQQIIEQRFEAIGPVVGKELKANSIKAIIVVLLAIGGYVAWAFRKVSWPVSSWKYGVVTLITLFHDVFITLGVFTILVQFTGWEINTTFVAAILTILGYSVNDTIVVFDRIRENLPKMGGSFEDIVNASVNQTISRSINTALTTCLALLAVLIFGGPTIRDFVTTMLIGISIGTYSSIFVASPLLVSWQYWQKK